MVRFRHVRRQGADGSLRVATNFPLTRGRDAAGARRDTVLLKNFPASSCRSHPRTSHRGHRCGRLHSPQTDVAVVSGGELQRNRHPAAGHQRAAAPASHRHLQQRQRLLRQLSGHRRPRGIVAVASPPRRVRGSDLPAATWAQRPRTTLSPRCRGQPNTSVVLNTGSAVTMPWLSSSSACRGLDQPRPGGRHQHRSALYGSYRPVRAPDRHVPYSLSQFRPAPRPWPRHRGNRAVLTDGIDVGFFSPKQAPPCSYDSKGQRRHCSRSVRTVVHDRPFSN